MSASEAISLFYEETDETIEQLTLISTKESIGPSSKPSNSILVVKDSNPSVTSDIDDLIQEVAFLNVSDEVNLCGETVNQFMVVSTNEAAKQVLKKLHDLFEITFDCEGVQLGRTGPLTVITMSAIEQNAISYIFDIIELGPEFLADCDNKYSMKKLLQSTSVKKITFDCRTDSDALFHQFDVKLNHCLDLQVYHQGIQKFNNTYQAVDDKGRPVFLKGCKTIAKEYLSEDLFNTLTAEAPHKNDNEIWKKRPLTYKQWSYAAYDPLLINYIYIEMKKIHISNKMMKRVIKGSKLYESKFRSHKADVTTESSKYYCFVRREAQI